jgi:hypothetical protein
MVQGTVWIPTIRAAQHCHILMDLHCHTTGIQII